MHKLIFYPLGNAASCLVELDNDRELLLDYAAVGDQTDEEEKRIDLEETLREWLEENDKDGFDIVAFTHLDADHISGATEFFYLEHDEAYQDDHRPNINTLWIPAAAIVEGDLDGEAAILQAEAQHRLIEGDGVRVFSRPEMLEEWLNEHDIALEDRLNLVSDAGTLVPEFSLERDSLEVFVHSPFARHTDEGEVVDRNIGSLCLHATFACGETRSRYLVTSDIDHDALRDIVNITEYNDNEDRLEWDVGDVPHHCSYRSLGPDKGKEETEPVDEVRRLWEEYGAETDPILVSSSQPIPSTDTDEPPHKQAAAYYSNQVVDEFVVTMEHPDESDPQPVEIEICETGHTLKKLAATGVATVTGTDAPRAGGRDD